MGARGGRGEWLPHEQVDARPVQLHPARGIEDFHDTSPPPSSSAIPYPRYESNLATAIKDFHDKFRELACMPFVEAEPPCQAPGGYNVNLLPGQAGRDVSATAREAAAARAEASTGAAALSARPSRLPPPVREFVELIFSERMMKQQLESLSIDLDNMPLGSITDRQVRRPSTCMSMSPAA